MTEPTCKTCTHFHQHYALDVSRCTSVNCGHCAYPRLKHRRPDSPACSHYLQRNTAAPIPDREAVVNFLTTDLLNYIMELKLPPIVERGEG